MRFNINHFSNHKSSMLSFSGGFFIAVLASNSAQTLKLNFTFLSNYYH